MQFLKTLFWVMVAVIAVVFAFRNWMPITIHLWGGLEADVKLPVLLLIAFLIGFLPWFTLHKTTRWRLRRRLEAAQRALEEERAKAVPPRLETPADPAADPLQNRSPSTLP